MQRHACPSPAVLSTHRLAGREYVYCGTEVGRRHARVSNLRRLDLRAAGRSTYSGGALIAVSHIHLEEGILTTVMALGARAGELFDAFSYPPRSELTRSVVLSGLTLSLPADATTWIPAAVSDATALSRSVVAAPPNDRLATLGRPLERAELSTKFMPAMMLLTVPELRAYHQPELLLSRTSLVPGIVEHLHGDHVRGLGDAKARSDDCARDVRAVA